jgi:hypothetical protein
LAERGKNGNQNIATVVGAEEKAAKPATRTAPKKSKKKAAVGKKKKTAKAR